MFLGYKDATHDSAQTLLTEPQTVFANCDPAAQDTFAVASGGWGKDGSISVPANLQSLIDAAKKGGKTVAFMTYADAAYYPDVSDPAIRALMAKSVGLFFQKYPAVDIILDDFEYPVNVVADDDMVAWWTQFADACHANGKQALPYYLAYNQLNHLDAVVPNFTSDAIIARFPPTADFQNVYDYLKDNCHVGWLPQIRAASTTTGETLQQGLNFFANGAPNMLGVATWEYAFLTPAEWAALQHALGTGHGVNIPTTGTINLQAQDTNGKSLVVWIHVTGTGYDQVIATSQTVTLPLGAYDFKGTYADTTLEGTFTLTIAAPNQTATLNFPTATVTPPPSPSGCFIASAAGMTPKELTQLRLIRDFVSQFPAGKKLVDFYYKKAAAYVPLVKSNLPLQNDIHDALEVILEALNSDPMIKRFLLTPHAKA